MSEIKKKLDGYFDVIIGNPPYNTNNEETGAVDETIYDKFCMAASKLNPKYESFIIPSKWIYGKARIPQEFSQGILTNKHLNYLELMDGKTAFPSVDTGEILIYSLDNTKDYEKIKFVDYGIMHEKLLNEITYQSGKNYWFKPIDSIIEKVQLKHLNSLASDIGFLTYKSGITFKSGNGKSEQESDILSKGNQTIAFKYDKSNSGRPTLDYSLTKTTKFSKKCYIPYVKLWKGDFPNSDTDKIMTHIYMNPNDIKDYCGNNIDHKLMVVPPRWHYHERLLDYPYNAFIMNSDEIAPAMYAIGKSIINDNELYNCQKYIKTKFVTYLLTINTTTQGFTPSCFAFVPYMDFTQEWTDEKLNKFFNLNEEEIKRINDLWAEFRPMRRAQLQELEENIEEGDDSEDDE